MSTAASLEARLRKVDALGSLSEGDLLDLPFEVRQMVYVALFDVLGIASLRDVQAVRARDRAHEKKEGKSADQRKSSELTYQRVFLKVVAKELNALRWKDTPNPEALHNRRDENYRAFDFLLSEIKRKELNTTTTTTTTRTPSPRKARDTPTSSKESYKVLSMQMAKSMITGKLPNPSIPSSKQSFMSSFVDGNNTSIEHDSKSSKPPLIKKQIKSNRLSTPPTDLTPSSNPRRSSSAPRSRPSSGGFSIPYTPVTPPSLSENSTAAHSPESNSPSSTTSSHSPLSTSSSSTVPALRPSSRSMQTYGMEMQDLATDSLTESIDSQDSNNSNNNNNNNTSHFSSSSASGRSPMKDLRKQYQALKLVYDQLVAEQPTEKVDERRLNMLKAQNIQLERQLLSLATNVRTRMWAVQDIVNRIQDVVQMKEAPQDLVAWAKNTSAKLTHVMNSAGDSLSYPFIVPGSTPGASTASVLDVCNGAATSSLIAPGRIWAVERSLAQLHKTLLALDLSLGTAISPSLLPPVQSHVATQMDQATKQLRSIIRDLTDLGIVVPQAPRPNLELPGRSELATGKSVEDLILRMPTVSRNNKEKVERFVADSFRDYSTKVGALEAELEVLRKEQELYKSTFALQNEYVSKLLRSMKDMNRDFEIRVMRTVQEPLDLALGALRAFEHSPHDPNALAMLIAILRQQSPALHQVLQASSDLTAPSSGRSDQHARFVDEFNALVTRHKQEYTDLIDQQQQKQKQKQKQKGNGNGHDGVPFSDLYEYINS